MIDLERIKPDPNGTFTIRQVLLLTHEFFPQRFRARNPDKFRIAHLEVSKVNHREYPSFEAMRKGERPVVKEYYRIITYLEPKYKRRKIRGTSRIFGRKVTKSYQIILEIDRLSIDTKHWQIRLGTGRVWQKMNGERFMAITRRERRLHPNVQRLLKVKALKANAFLNEGDWNALALGINADFIFRCSFVYKKYGHLYGITQGLPDYRPPVKTNPKGIMFFPKHILNFLELLAEMKILISEQKRK